MKRILSKDEIAKLYSFKSIEEIKKSRFQIPDLIIEVEAKEGNIRFYWFEEFRGPKGLVEWRSKNGQSIERRRVQDIEINYLYNRFDYLISRLDKYWLSEEDILANDYSGKDVGEGVLERLDISVLEKAVIDTIKRCSRSDFLIKEYNGLPCKIIDYHYSSL